MAIDFNRTSASIDSGGRWVVFSFVLTHSFIIARSEQANMDDSKRGGARKFTTCFEDALRADLHKYIGKIKNVKNGGNLHPMIISLVEKPLITMVLEETGGNQTEAALLLGMNRNTLRRKMTEHKIKIRKSNSKSGRQ